MRTEHIQISISSTLEHVKALSVRLCLCYCSMFECLCSRKISPLATVGGASRKFSTTLNCTKNVSVLVPSFCAKITEPKLPPAVYMCCLVRWLKFPNKFEKEVSFFAPLKSFLLPCETNYFEGLSRPWNAQVRGKARCDSISFPERRKCTRKMGRKSPLSSQFLVTRVKRLRQIKFTTRATEKFPHCWRSP